MSGHELVSRRLPWTPDSDQILEWCALIPEVMLKALSGEGPAAAGDLQSKKGLEEIALFCKLVYFTVIVPLCSSVLLPLELTCNPSTQEGEPEG